MRIFSLAFTAILFLTPSFVGAFPPPRAGGPVDVRDDFLDPATVHFIPAKIEAIDAGCLECIMLNTEGFVTEGSGDNIFIVKDGEIFTPPSEAGILEGITRKFVIEELAPLVGVDVTEKELRIEDVYEADEIFLTGSAAEVIAVTRIGDNEDDARIVGSGSEGTITNKLRTKFRQIVTSDNIPEN